MNPKTKTILQSTRTVFILDISGSMRGLKSETLQLSTKRYIEDISDNSYVGLVLFNNKASIEHKVVKITDRKVRDSLIKKVPETSGGNTDIGNGLLMALNSLTEENLSTEGANFILVTDGEDNTRTNYVDRVMPFLLNAKVKIICIALGNTADPNLERLANETNGKVFIASDSNREMAVRVIESAFIETKANNCKELNEALTISVCNDLIKIDQTVNKKVIIDSDIGRNTNFIIGSEDIDKFSVSILSPNGKMFDMTSKEFTKNKSYKRYQLSLSNAESGVWTLNLERNTSETLCATVSVRSQPFNPNAIQMRVWLKDVDNISQIPPIIFAEIRKGADAVIGAEVIATIDKPNGTQTHVKLSNYNNIYCNLFTDYCGSGRYNVSVSAKNDGNCQIFSKSAGNSVSSEAKQSYFNWFISNIKSIVPALGIQSVPHFERQHIVGCFKVTDSMPSEPKTLEKLEEMLTCESLKYISMFSNRNYDRVESPAPRNAKTPIARVRTSIAKKTDQQIDEIKIAKDDMRDTLLVVKKLLRFSKLPEDEKVSFKEIVEEIDNFVYSTKSGSVKDVESYSLKLEDLKKTLSNK